MTKPRLLINANHRYRHIAILGVVLTLVASLMAVLFINLGSSVNADTGYGPDSGRPFAADSPWNKPIGTNPSLDSKSSGIASLLSSGTNPAAANMYEFGIPIYHVDASTPKVNVSCTYTQWGQCPITQARIPSHARPHSGSDGAMVIVDWSDGKSYEFWQAKKLSNGQWQYSWGAVVTDFVNGLGDGPATTASAVAAGTSRLAGTILEREIAAGEIPHALVFSTKHSCQNTWRYPAEKTDGRSSHTNCIPQGARIQLDPSINVDAIPNITPGEKAIAKALQEYGAYNIDSGGANMGFSFELTEGANSSNPIPQTYQDAGLGWDYFSMPNIPWDQIRVLSAWDAGTQVPDPDPNPDPDPDPINDTQAPTAPTNLSVGYVDRWVVSLWWDPSTDNVGVDHYNVWRGDANWSNWELIGQVDSDEPWFNDTNIQRGKSYTYGIRAVDAAGNISQGSNNIKVSVPRY